MTKIEYKIRDRSGLHARVAVKLHEAAVSFKSTCSIVFGNTETAATDVMGLMLLDIREGDIIEIKADGPDEEQAVIAICSVFET
jgi:phosphotransferase system HPr (HPr) family protein